MVGKIVQSEATLWTQVQEIMYTQSQQYRMLYSAIQFVGDYIASCTVEHTIDNIQKNVYSNPTPSLELRFKMHGQCCNYVHCVWIEETYIQL